MQWLALFGFALFGSDGSRRAAGSIIAGAGTLLLVLALATQLGPYGLIWAVMLLAIGFAGIVGVIALIAAQSRTEAVYAQDPARDHAERRGAERAKAEEIWARHAIRLRPHLDASEIAQVEALVREGYHQQLDWQCRTLLRQRCGRL